MKYVSKVKKIIIKVLKKKGLLLIREDNYNFDINYYHQLIQKQNSKISQNQHEIVSIVFSKDRAMQLHAFLSSYLQNVQNYGTIYILYKVSDERHKKSYEELQTIYMSSPFIFVEEKQFRLQLIEIVSNSKAKLVGFYVDDMIFLQKVDYNVLLDIPSLESVVTLSRGKELTHSVVLNKEIDLPDFTKLQNGLISFKWNQYECISDWTYPLGVSGYFYGKIETEIMLNNIFFKAPNSLEDGLQRYINFFKNRNGVCFENVACCCVHANIVQTEWINPTIGDFSIEDLLSKWEEGMMIDLNPFYGRTGDIAQYLKYNFVKR